MSLFLSIQKSDAIGLTAACQNLFFEVILNLIYSKKFDDR